MAYNNYFPNNFMPQYYQAAQQQQPQPNNYQNGIIWVQGEAGAKSFLVAPNTTVQLWDSEAQIIYLKSADASGMPTMKIIDYTIRGMNSPEAEQQSFVTREEFEALKTEVQKLAPRPQADEKRRKA